MQTTQKRAYWFQKRRKKEQSQQKKQKNAKNVVAESARSHAI